MVCCHAGMHHFQLAVLQSSLYHYLHQREWKEHYSCKAKKSWWEGLFDFAQTNLDFDVLVKKAYAVHGKGVRKCYQFPDVPIWPVLFN